MESIRTICKNSLKCSLNKSDVIWFSKYLVTNVTWLGFAIKQKIFPINFSGRFIFGLLSINDEVFFQATTLQAALSMSVCFLV